MRLDAELISIFHDAFNRLGLEIIVKVNNRKILDGIMRLQDLVRSESVRRRSSPEYTELLASYNIK